MVRMALALRELRVESIPLNFLIDISGTPLQRTKNLTPRYCLKALAMFRLVNPSSEIRIAGGRELHRHPPDPAPEPVREAHRLARRLRRGAEVDDRAGEEADPRRLPSRAVVARQRVRAHEPVADPQPLRRGDDGGLGAAGVGHQARPPQPRERRLQHRGGGADGDRDQKHVRLFELVPNGDPYTRHAFDVREYVTNYRERFPTFRGDLSPLRGRRNAIVKLRHMYPGCRIRLSR